MNTKTTTQIEFKKDGEIVAQSRELPIPTVGEIVEVGGRFTDEGERVYPSETSFSEWEDCEYRTFVSGRVAEVTKHYHTALSREEMTVTVALEEVENDE